MRLHGRGQVGADANTCLEVIDLSVGSRECAILTGSCLLLVNLHRHNVSRHRARNDSWLIELVCSA